MKDNALQGLGVFLIALGTLLGAVNMLYRATGRLDVAVFLPLILVLGGTAVGAAYLGSSVERSYRFFNLLDNVGLIALGGLAYRFIRWWGPRKPFFDGKEEVRQLASALDKASVLAGMLAILGFVLPQVALGPFTVLCLSWIGLLATARALRWLAD